MIKHTSKDITPSKPDKGADREQMGRVRSGGQTGGPDREQSGTRQEAGDRGAREGSARRQAGQMRVHKL